MALFLISSLTMGWCMGVGVEVKFGGKLKGVRQAGSQRDEVNEVGLGLDGVDGIGWGGVVDAGVWSHEIE